MSTPDNAPRHAASAVPSEAELFLQELVPHDSATRRRAFLQLLRQLVGDNTGGPR